MGIEFKPPWLLYSFGWLSMGWKCGSGETDRIKFEDWYADLSDVERSKFKNKYPESPWWPNYYYFIENIRKENRGGINPGIFLKEIKEQQKKYAELVYLKALELEAIKDYEAASDLYVEIGTNSGPFKDSSERYELIRKRNEKI